MRHARAATCQRPAGAGGSLAEDGDAGRDGQIRPAGRNRPSDHRGHRHAGRRHVRRRRSPPPPRQPVKADLPSGGGRLRGCLPVRRGRRTSRGGCGWPSWACRAAAVLISARAATAAPAGSARSAARTAAAGLWSAAGATGAGSRVVAASAALWAACGAAAGILVRAMMVTPFLFSGAILFLILPAPVLSGRQLLWSRREVKRIRDNSRCRFPPQPCGHATTLSRIFRGSQRLSALK